MPAKPRQAKTAAKTPEAARATAAPVRIDYPQEGEHVLPGHYAVRLWASEADALEVSLDGKTWEACRSSVGFFWYDWTPSALGPQELRARALKGGKPGRGLARRACVVSDAPPARLP